MGLNAWPMGAGTIRRCGLVRSVSLWRWDFGSSMFQPHPVWNTLSPLLLPMTKGRPSAAPAPRVLPPRFPPRANTLSCLWKEYLKSPNDSQGYIVNESPFCTAYLLHIILLTIVSFNQHCLHLLLPASHPWKPLLSLRPSKLSLLDSACRRNHGELSFCTSL